ncbi:ribonuclease P protein component, partial [bacterium]
MFVTSNRYTNNEYTSNEGVVSLGGERFPKRARLLRRSEFLNLSRTGKKVYTSHFVVLSKTNDKGENRLGVTVSARVGKAVARNRIKRLLREFFRRHSRELSSPQDIVIIARKGAGELLLDEVTKELRGALIY